MIGAPTMLMASCAAAMTAAATSVGPRMLGLTDDYDDDDTPGKKRVSVCSITRFRKQSRAPSANSTANFLLVPTQHFGGLPQTKYSSSSAGCCHREEDNGGGGAASEALLLSPPASAESNNESVIGGADDCEAAAGRPLSASSRKRISFNVPCPPEDSNSRSCYEATNESDEECKKYNDDDAPAVAEAAASSSSNSPPSSFWWNPATLVQNIVERVKAVKL